MTETPHLGLPLIASAQAQKHVTHNAALQRLDALVMLAVLDRDMTAPPAAPAAGDRYIVKAPATGEFAGKVGQVAHFVDGGWDFHTPAVGWLCYVIDEGALIAWHGGGWQAVAGGEGGGSDVLQNLALLGLGTTADAVNPLSAKLNNALWTAKSVAEGGDGTLRFKINKESAAKTASLLFQDAWSGRAEIGLAGDDDLHVRTSPDGSGWTDALVIEQATGATRINAALHLSGAVSPAPLAADENDYGPAGLGAAAMVRLVCTAPRTLTGLAGGGAGRVLMLHNVGTAPIVLKDESAASSAANRFALPSDLVVAADAVALLHYDPTSQRWRALAGGGGSTTAVTPFAQCRLAKSGGTLVLSRHGGRHLFIDGANEVVPQAGVSLGPSGLTPATLYYVYAFMSAGSMTLEASTTVPAIDASWGHMIKSGDATRSLVGMARPVAGPAFADTATQRLVRSWFNRRRLHGQNGFTVNRTTASTTPVELHGEIRIEFLVWADESVRACLNPVAYPAATTYAAMFNWPAFDGTPEDAVSYSQAWNTIQALVPAAVTIEKSGLAEGYHYLTMLAAIALGAATWWGSTTGTTRTTLWMGI